jgi:hypothetical protein
MLFLSKSNDLNEIVNKGSIHLNEIRNLNSLINQINDETIDENYKLPLIQI